MNQPPANAPWGPPGQEPNLPDSLAAMVDGADVDPDAPIADSPSWGAIGIMAGVILFGAAAGAGAGFALGGGGMLWVGAILGAFAGGMFGAAGIGWTYRNMDWIPMTYPERTLILVLGILFLTSPLALNLLHVGR